MTAQYYICWCLLDKTHRYLIWCSNDKDYVFTEKGKVPVFQTQEQALAYAALKKMKIEPEEPVLHDLDVVANWLADPSPERVDCSVFNAALNFLDDLWTAIDGKFRPHPKLTKRIQDKLFFGLNLPSVTPRRKQYVPSWTEAEVRILNQVFTAGLDLFRASMSEKV